MSVRRPVPRCYLVVAYAPEDSRPAAASDAFNAFVADPARGLVLTHDHFGDRPGGYAVFACETREQVERLHQPGELPAWELAVHPLIFSWTAERWVYQADYTLAAYRGFRLKDLLDRYRAGEDHARLSAQWDRRTAPRSPEEGAP